MANYKLNCVEQICKKQIVQVNKNKKSNVGSLLINFADDKIVVLHRILNIEDVRNKLIKIVNDIKKKNTNEKESAPQKRNGLRKSQC